MNFHAIEMIFQSAITTARWDYAWIIHTCHTDCVRTETSVRWRNQIVPGLYRRVACDVRADVGERAYLPYRLQSRRRVHAHCFFDKVVALEIGDLTLPDIQVHQTWSVFGRERRSCGRIRKVRLLTVRDGQRAALLAKHGIEFQRSFTVIFCKQAVQVNSSTSNG